MHKKRLSFLYGEDVLSLSRAIRLNDDVLARMLLPRSLPINGNWEIEQVQLSQPHYIVNLQDA